MSPHSVTHKTKSKQPNSQVILPRSGSNKVPLSNLRPGPGGGKTPSVIITAGWDKFPCRGKGWEIYHIWAGSTRSKHPHNSAAANSCAVFRKSLEKVFREWIFPIPVVALQEFGVPFMETSARSGLNVELAFTAVAKWVLCHFNLLNIGKQLWRWSILLSWRNMNTLWRFTFDLGDSWEEKEKTSVREVSLFPCRHEEYSARNNDQIYFHTKVSYLN